MLFSANMEGRFSLYGGTNVSNQQFLEAWTVGNTGQHGGIRVNLQCSGGGPDWDFRSALEHLSVYVYCFFTAALVVERPHSCVRGERCCNRFDVHGEN